MDPNELSQAGFSTRALHAGQKPDPITGAISTPIFQTSTYVQEEPGKHTGYEYSRTGNPTRTAYEQCVASLEDAKFGLAFGSGMAATQTIIQLLSSGDHVVCCDDLYGGSPRLFDQVYARFGIEFSYADLSDGESCEKTLDSLIQPKTKMLWLETPTNPLLRILDIKKLSTLAHSKGLIVVVDNTFLSPYFQKPISLGADIVLHSVSKYLNGHTDVVGGVAVTNDPKIHADLAFLQNAAGAIPGPMDSFLVLRGMKTLAIRMDRHAENAMTIAKTLSGMGSSQIAEVIYPGLPSHPQHELAKKQMSGFGGMISVRFQTPEIAHKFLTRLRIFRLAESLGGVESMVNHPAKMTHAAIPESIRTQRGIDDSLARLSIGIEDCEDLLNDISRALI